MITNNDWSVASVEHIRDESPAVKTITFRMPAPVTNLAGQRYELRLNAENGYQAARLYSANSANNKSTSLKLTIMRVPTGEVSPYVVDELAVGDQVEIRGPFGKFFTWSADVTDPILVIGGGSGIVPIHAIFDAHQRAGSKTDVKMLYSEHTYDDILFKDDLLNDDDVIITLTKQWPKTWQGQTGRVSTGLIDELLGSFSKMPICYVCGMNRFVNAVSDGLVAAGVPADRIKTERFG